MQEKIQMPCTEEQFNRDLKPFLVDAGVDIKCCQSFCKNPYIQTPYHSQYVVGCFTIEQEEYKTIDYNPKQFLKHLGIDIYEVGDVVNIGKYECMIKKFNECYFLSFENYGDLIYKQFGLKESDLKYALNPQIGYFPFHATLYDLNKTIKFLKSHENKMQEKPFTLEQAKEMLAIESLKELAYQYYPELQSPVNTINEELLSQLSYGMFGQEDVLSVAVDTPLKIGKPHLKYKAIYLDCDYDVVLYRNIQGFGGTIIEFIEKAKNA